MIAYGRQDISEEDIAAVVEVLRSEWLTQGPAIERFEENVARYCGARYAVAVSSATAALHIACLAAELKSGDVLWTSPNTFVASANCALYCDALPDFVEIEPDTGNMSVSQLAAKLARAECPPKLVVPVHFAGQPVDMAGIAKLAARYGFAVIEDASHAIGASYGGVRVGSCQHSDMTVLSFHPVKIVTSGEGGMVLTNRKDLYERLLRLRSHGITRDAAHMVREPDGPWYYEQIELGFNYRMTDIQAALGASQLERVDGFVERRRLLADRYDTQLRGLPLTHLAQRPDAYSSFHLYVVRLELNAIGKSQRQVFDELRDLGIGVNLHYIPVHTQPYYRHLGFKRGDFPVAEAYYGEAMTLPLYPALTFDMQDRVISALHTVLGE